MPDASEEREYGVVLRCTGTGVGVTREIVEKQKLLIISYLFPPAGGIAVQRALSLAKYLPGCGFDVHVLSARNAAGPVSDPDLLRQVPVEVTLHSAFTPEIPFAI